LIETIKGIKDVKDELNKIEGSEADAIKQKLKSCALDGQDLHDSEDLKDLSVSDTVCYNYARILYDMERTFSQYKSLVHDNRHSFTIHNLKITFLVHCSYASFPIWNSHDFL
jgi:hypothetical protein